VSAQGAAPKGGTFGRGSIDGERADHTLLPESLPARVIERLRAEGVYSLGDWGRLTRMQKCAVWGVTRRMAAELDRLAREATR
jgi:hypothetical protein